MLQESPIGAYNFSVLRAILEDLQLIKIGFGAEVGVFDGGTSSYLLSRLSTLRLVGVDPYKAYHEYDQARLIQAEATADSRLAQFGERWMKIKDNSIEAAKRFLENSFDFVFIDADHNFDAVKGDIEAWYPKVRSQGLFCGHDYRWPGVTRAVHEFAEIKGLQGHFSPKESDIWWFIKP